MDRLAASAHRISLAGKSLRKKKIIKFEKHCSCLVVDQRIQLATFAPE